MSWEFLLQLLISILIVYVAFGAFLYTFQRSMMYHPSGTSFHDCTAFTDAERVVHNGTRMFYTPVSEDLVVFYHGNAGSACERASLSDRFNELGYSTLFVEYDGYGGHDGTPTKQGLLRNAADAAAWIDDQSFSTVTVIGSSLGSSPAAYHASSGIDGLILVSPYDSVAHVARSNYPVYPISWLLKDDFDNVELLQEYTGPVLILHAEQDTVVPFERGAALYRQLPSEENQFERLDTGHNRIYDQEEFWKHTSEFLP